MRPTRKCEFCGKTFVPRSGMQKYCSEECQAEAKRLRKKRQQDLINGIEPIMGLQHQEYLTFSKAAVLMGCTRQYIYKLVANGKLKASRLSSRMAFVRKSDIEKMFDGNPYRRVVPASKSKLSQKAKTEKPTQKQESTKGKEENEVLDYYSGEEGIREGEVIGIHEGRLETTINNIRNLMHTQNWSAEKAMNALGFDASEYPKYLALLQN